jgi:tetratricopeptide (TPR) repeat protein
MIKTIAVVALVSLGMMQLPAPAQTAQPVDTQSEPVMTPAQYAPAVNTPAAGLAADLDKVRKRTEAIEESIASVKSWIGWGISILTVLFAIASFFGWQVIRDRIVRLVERNLDVQLKSALQEKLPERLADVQAKAESYLLRFAQLQALHGLGHFDEALKAYGWDGNVSRLRNESPTIRRLLIECLQSSREDRKVTRQHAWEALNELVNDDSGIETKRLFLRISHSSRRIREGVAFVDKCRSDCARDRESALRAATLLRKSNRQVDALELVKGVYDAGDLECVVHSAVLQRDLGDFDQAHDVLIPFVTSLVGEVRYKLPEGWHRIVNTYIANCIDRKRPDDGVRPAEFVLRSSPGAVEVFTAGRLIRALPDSNPSRPELLRRFSEAIDGLAAGEARIRCEVLMLQMSGLFDEAERVLKEAIAAEPKSGKRELDSDTYFQHCTLGEFYIDRERPDDAIDALMPATSVSFGGEAKFYLAVAYALKNEGRDAARWLTQALQELPKWASHARDHSALRGIPEIAEVLSSNARSRQRVNAGPS